MVTTEDWKLKTRLTSVAAVLGALLAVLIMAGCNLAAAGVPAAPTPPTMSSAVPGNTQVTVSWTAVSGATSYNLYWSTTSGVTKTTGTRITGVTIPYTQTGLTNGTTYYYIVTAANGGDESSASNQASATPAAAPAVPTFTLAPPTSTTSSFVQISSTTGATIYYTVALNGATPATPTTSSEIYNGSNADLYVYGNVNVAVSAFATMNGQNSAVTAQTFQSSSITPFSIAAASTGVSFSLNGNSYGIDLTTPDHINFTPSSGWWCVYPSSAPAPATIAETSSYFVIPLQDLNIPYTVGFMNASTPAAATIYFQVSNVYVSKT